MLVEILVDGVAYPNGFDKVQLSKGSSIELEPSDAKFLIERDMAKVKKETKPVTKKKETKPLKTKKETK
jgi:hypothetical protein